VETLLAQAFPAVDASQEELQRMAEVPPDEKLLAAAPLPEPIELEELEEEVARTRVVFVRGAAAIPLSLIASIGGALLIHMLLVGGFLLALYFAVNLRSRSGGGGGMMARGMGGGSQGGYMIENAPPGDLPGEAKTVEQVLGGAVAPPMPETPALPEMSDAGRAARQLVPQESGTAPGDNAMIGIPSGDRLGSVRIAPPPPRRVVTVTPPTPAGVAAPPSSEAKNGTILASAGNTTGSPASPTRGGGGGRGRGGEDDYGDEMIIPLSKGNGGGSGGGSGGGIGRGSGRGASGADNPEPMILDWAMPEFSPALYMDPPKRSTKFKVTVKVNGEAGEIEMVQSCGKPAIDAQWKQSLKNAKFRPAYRAGRPYEAVKEVEYRLGKP
jgi:hypothetical protein